MSEEINPDSGPSTTTDSKFAEPNGWTGKRGQSHALKYCALTGALGVASGFALFAYLWYAGEHAHPVQLAAGLAVAAVMSYVFESLKEQMPSAASAEGGEHQPHRLSWGGWMSTVLMLFAFELFVVSWHSMPELGSGQFVQLAHAISGTPDAPPWLSLGGLIVIWIAVGSCLAACLGVRIGAGKGSLPILSRDGALHGALAGFIVPPVVMLVAVLGVRLLLSLQLFIFEPDKWRTHLDAVTARVGKGWFVVPFYVLRFFDWLASYAGPLRPVLLIAIPVGYAAYTVAQQKGAGAGCVDDVGGDCAADCLAAVGESRRLVDAIGSVNFHLGNSRSRVGGDDAAAGASVGEPQVLGL